MAYQLGDILVRAIMENVTGLPEDRVMNDFAFATGPTAPSGTDIVNAVDAVDHFYRTTGGGTGDTVSEYISGAINRSATHTIEVYSITALGLGSPIYTTNWLGPVAVNTLDNQVAEVAAVLSFHSDLTGVAEEAPGGTRPRARRRGRVYIGPLTLTAVDYATPNPRLSAAMTAVLREAGSRLISESSADAIPWSVWSRADEILRPVVGGWTDNAPDTQRRRGVSSTIRATWT